MDMSHMIKFHLKSLFLDYTQLGLFTPMFLLQVTNQYKLIMLIVVSTTKPYSTKLYTMIVVYLYTNEPSVLPHKNHTLNLISFQPCLTCTIFFLFPFFYQQMNYFKQRSNGQNKKRNLNHRHQENTYPPGSYPDKGRRPSPQI